MFSRFRTWLQTRKPQPIRRAPRLRLGVEPLENRLLLTGASVLGAQPNVIAASPHWTAGPTGYTPAQMRQAYGFDQIRGLPNNDYNNAGKGQTIAIVGFFSDPTLRSDTQQFDEYFNIQGAAGNAADTSFLRIVNQNGGTALPAPANAYSGWDTEESIDVQWAHAIAPGANILLVEADSNDEDANEAVQYAESQPNVSVISISYGDNAEWPSQYLEDAVYTTPVGHQGVAFVIASGDFGAATLGYPDSPNALMVGGTTLPADQNGNPDRSLETGWSLGSDAGPPLYNPYWASTGGISTVEAEPAYQAGIQAYLNAEGYPSGGYRAVPDVSYDADPNTGVPIYDTYSSPPGTPWGYFGGTSIGAPQWAALIAIADQARAVAGERTLDGPSQLLPSIYQIAQTDPRAFQNISTGNNGYNAGPGYNLITGLGTPNAQFLVPDLVQADSTPAAPATVYWTGDAGDNSWNNAGNWSLVDPAVRNVPGSVLPGPHDNVVVDVPGATVNHAANSYDSIRSLTVTAPNVQLNLDGGTLDLSGGGALGTFQVDQPGDVVNLGGGSSAVGGVLKDAIVTSHTVLTVPASTDGTVDGGVLDGSVQAQAASTLFLEGSWTNNGTITAGTGSTLLLGSYWSAYRNDPTAQAGAWVNNGTITVNDATVELGGWLTWTGTNLNSLNLSTDDVELLGTLDNVGRTLTLTPGLTSRSGSWALAGGRIDGGTIATVGSAALIASAGAANPSVAPFYIDGGNTLDDVTLAGTLDMSASGTSPTYYGAYVSVVDGLTLNAPLDLSGSYATLQFNDASPLILNADLDVSGYYAALNFNDGGGVTTGPHVPDATIDLSGQDAAFVNMLGSSLAYYGTTYPTVTVGRGVTIAGNSSASIVVGPIDNRGTIEQNGPGDLTVTFGLVNDGSIRASNGGVLTLEAYPFYPNDTYPSSGDVPWSNSSDGTITATQGATLNLYDNWTNQGVIRVSSFATVSLGSPVTDSSTYFSTAGYIWNSPGILAIAPGATINLGDYLTTDDFESHFRQLGVNLNLSQYKVNLIGTLDNNPADNPLTGGNLILDRATGSLYLSASVIDGGTIATRGSNALVATNSAYTYDDSIGFLGVAMVATNWGYFYVYSNPVAIGGGTLIGVRLDGVLDMQLIPAATATVLGGLTVNGVLALSGPGATLDVAGAFSNAGIVAIGKGALVSVGAADYSQLGGSTTVDGTLVAANVDLDSGVLSGDGTIQANVVNAALIVPGDPFGTLTVQGNYTQTASGVLLIPIAGPKQYGQLAVTGSATLDGTLQVSLLDNYVPAVGASFPILTFADYGGGFATEVGLILPHHRSLKPVWDSNDLTLMAD
jgi:hypothetical protein